MMAGDAFYHSSAWRIMREVVLSEQPFCVYCDQMGYTEPATVVDHIVRRRDRPDLALERSNLQGLCKYHHDSVKAREENAGREIGCGADGEPLGGWHA